MVRSHVRFSRRPRQCREICIFAWTLYVILSLQKNCAASSVKAPLRLWGTTICLWLFPVLPVDRGRPWLTLHWALTSARKRNSSSDVRPHQQQTSALDRTNAHVSYLIAYFVKLNKRSRTIKTGRWRRKRQKINKGLKNLNWGKKKKRFIWLIGGAWCRRLQEICLVKLWYEYDAVWLHV